MKISMKRKLFNIKWNVKRCFKIRPSTNACKVDERKSENNWETCDEDHKMLKLLARFLGRLKSSSKIQQIIIIITVAL